jgi:hypothetical protein
MDIHLEDKTSVKISKLICPLFSNIKNLGEPFELKKTSKETLDFICKFADEFVLMDEKDKKKYESPQLWEESSEEYANYRRWFDPLSSLEVINAINAGELLGFNVFVNICCFRIAKLITGKTPEEIRALLGITNDFNEEEEKNIANENNWYI